MSLGHGNPGGMFKIYKLGESNFHIWEQKVELLLASLDLKAPTVDSKALDSKN